METFSSSRTDFPRSAGWEQSKQPNSSDMMNRKGFKFNGMIFQIRSKKFEKLEGNKANPYYCVRVTTMVLTICIFNLVLKLFIVLVLDLTTAPLTPLDPENLMIDFGNLLYTDT